MRTKVAILAAVIVAAILGWTAWWFVLATARDDALTVWLEDRRAAGWVAEAADIRVGGYPARVDSHVAGLSLADPRAGWSWQADGLDVLQLAYKPQHVIAVLGGEQVVATPYDTFRATGDTLRGSILFRPNTRLELDHMTFEIADMAIRSDAGWTSSIGKAVLATRQAASGAPNAHDLAFDAENLAIPRLAESAQGVLPAAIGKVSLDSTLRFDRPWDRPSAKPSASTASVPWPRRSSLPQVSDRSRMSTPSTCRSTSPVASPASARSRSAPLPASPAAEASSRAQPPGGRKPAACAAAASQNQTSPRLVSIRVRS